MTIHAVHNHNHRLLTAPSESILIIIMIINYSLNLITGTKGYSNVNADTLL